MDSEQRKMLITQMGGDVTTYSIHAERGEWPAARIFLTRLAAAVGAMAMEVDENDPVEQGN